MADDFYGFDDDEAEEKGKDNLFLWTVFILLLIGLAFACWLGSFYIFGHPENPWCYKLLRKAKKLDAPMRFEVTQAPPGEFLSPQRLFDKYSKYTRLELQQENDLLLRNYLRNYRETKKLVPYIMGRFNIVDSYELKRGAMFDSGVVALAQANDFPQVLVEHVYPTPPENVSALRTLLHTGLDMKIERSVDLSAVIHIEKIYDGRLQFTLVPLLYGTYALKQGVGTFSLEPPTQLNMEAGVPLTPEPVLKNALIKYLAFRRQVPVADPDENLPTPTPGPELVRVDTVEPGNKVPEAGAMPVVPVATPIPLRGQPTPRPLVAAATPQPTPGPLALLTTPPPVPAGTPSPISTAIPVATPGAVVVVPFDAAARLAQWCAADAVHRFVARAGTMPSVPGASWRTYAPGQAPAARTVTPAEATALADRGDLGERIYLRGEFRVTASGESRAVLRDRAEAAEVDGGTSGERVRIIVEFPAGAVPPPENSAFDRDAARPLRNPRRAQRRGWPGEHLRPGNHRAAVARGPSQEEEEWCFALYFSVSCVSKETAADSPCPNENPR